jgi:hypothetical protein
VSILYAKKIFARKNLNKWNKKLSFSWTLYTKDERGKGDQIVGLSKQQASAILCWYSDFRHPSA